MPGRRLLARAEQWAVESGAKSLTVETSARNQRALKLYRDVGFEDEDVRLAKSLAR